jgi:hypothetical protein
VVRFLVGLSEFFFSKSSIMDLELLFNFKHSRKFCDLNSFLCACVKLHGLRVTKPTSSNSPRFFDNTFVVDPNLKNRCSISATFQLCGKFMTFITWNLSSFKRTLNSKSLTLKFLGRTRLLFLSLGTFYFILNFHTLSPFWTLITVRKRVECAFRLTFPFFHKNLHLNTHHRSIVTNIHVK